jgi:type III restriction enzyme
VIVQREYILKESFKTDSLYTHGLIFLNEKIVKSRKDVHCLSPKVRDDIYHFKASSGVSGIDAVMAEETQSETVVKLQTFHTTIKEIADINYAIVNKAIMKYPILKFNTLHSYFPNLTSTRQFVTDEEYLGKVRIDIESKDEIPTMGVLYSAVFYVLGKIANSNTISP